VDFEHNKNMDEEWKEEAGAVKLQSKRENRILNSCFLLFVGFLMMVSLITFFVAIWQQDNQAAYNIASIYILCMILALPALKLFFDRAVKRIFKMMNMYLLIAAFFSILIMTSAVVIDAVI